MLSAMVLGDRTYLDHQARVGFERTGSFHLLVVSGMHLAIFAGCIFAPGWVLRLPRIWATTVTIVLFVLPMRCWPALASRCSARFGW